MNEILTSEKEFIYIISIAIAILLLMAVSIVLFFYFSRKKIVEAKLDKAQLEVSYQKELLQNSILVQEKERKRIAQDLHDAISSKLNVVSLNAGILTGQDDMTSDEIQKIGKGIHKITSTVLENSRRIAHDLLPPTLDKFGLQPALEELCEDIEATQVFVIHYDLDYVAHSLSKDHELHLFRIVQELFNNAIKHSGASNIRLTLKCTQNNVSLHYSDNGKGFDLLRIKNAKGLGMSGIENRVALMNASCQLNTSLGNGLEMIINCKSITHNAN